MKNLNLIQPVQVCFQFLGRTMILGRSEHRVKLHTQYNTQLGTLWTGNLLYWPRMLKTIIISQLVVWGWIFAVSWDLKRWHRH